MPRMTHSLVPLIAGTLVLFTACAAGAEEVRLPISRDTWVSDVGKERDNNMGGASKLKTKGIQEMSIIDIDPAKLRGRVVTAATLHFKPASKDLQPRLTISSLASDWVEGTSGSYAKEKGMASFLWAATDERPWANFPGSDLLAVTLGYGNTRWRHAESTPPDKDGWQTVAVDADVVAARVAGISYGFVVVDDVGSEYDRDGDKFTYRHMPNRFIASRESGAKSAPYMTITTGDEDKKAPAQPKLDLVSATKPPAGEFLVRWATPADDGPAGVIGFVARYAEGDAFDWATAKPIPQYLVPMAGKTNEVVTMHARDLGFLPGKNVRLGIAAVDRAGNIGQPAVISIVVPQVDSLALKDAGIKPFEPAGEYPKVGDLDVAVVDALDKINLATGEMIPKRDEKYRMGNHLWSAKDKTIRLHAARNETVAFQIILSGRSGGVMVDLPAGKQADSPRAELFVLRGIPAAGGALLPDPAVPLKGAVAIPPAGVDSQKHAAVLVNLYIPPGSAAGSHPLSLRLADNGKTLDLKIDLTIWDFTLPDHLSFLPEMNSYGLPNDDIAYYRLARKYRTVLNRLGYNWRGGVHAETAPKWDGKTFDWTAYDAHYGPILDGSAFKDLPGGAIPIECFYLPINENWPVDVNKHFKGGYWIDKAFDEDYRKQFVEASRRFAEHFAQKGWTKTFVQFYLNNKVYNKKDSWAKSSAPWILDEPVNTQDFIALRWYGVAFHEGVAAFPDVRMLYRCDVSRPQWQRDMFDGVINYNVIGGAFRQYARIVNDRREQNGELVVNYGSSNVIADSNIQPAAWCIDTWTSGGDGVLPWQTIGRDKSWTAPDQESLFYPGGPAGVDGPVASVRLASYQRGQQDIEYLTLLQQTTGMPRHVVADLARITLKLKASLKKTSEEDAGLISYGALDPQALWAMRVNIGKMLSDAKPAAKPMLIDLMPRREDPKTMLDNWQVGQQ